MADKLQTYSSWTTRQKATAGIFILVLLVVVWQAYKMFRSGTPTPTAQTTTAAKSTKAANTSGPVATVVQKTPLIKPEATTAREAELMKLQQETQAKYLTAVSELQMLRIARDIAQTNQAIMTARLTTVTAQKKIVDMLSPPAPVQPPPQAYSSALISPVGAQQQKGAAGLFEEEVKYVVISVSQLQYRWSAVLGAKGVLYNVHVGDVLPPDNARVLAIDRNGVVLQKNGMRRRISLVPII